MGEQDTGGEIVRRRRAKLALTQPRDESIGAGDETASDGAHAVARAAGDLTVEPSVEVPARAEMGERSQPPKGRPYAATIPQK